MAVLAPARHTTSAPGSPTPRRWRRYRSRTFYAFTAPWLIGFLALTALPMAYALQLSFTDANGVTPTQHYVGLANYTAILHDPDVLSSLARTGEFTVVVVPLTVAGSLLLALLVNQPVRGVGVFRTLFYLPAVLPGVASALIWKTVFDQNSGAANGVLHLVGAGPVAWLQDPASSYVLVLLMMWGVGGGMLVSLSGLQDVPRELQEAARVDGANAWQTFWHVTLPMLSPILLFQVVTGVISALQVVVQPILLAPNTPGQSPTSATAVPRGNDLFMVHVFAQYMSFGRFGYGSALLWLLFVVVLATTALVLALGRRLVFYNVDPGHSGKES